MGLFIMGYMLVTSHMEGESLRMVKGKCMKGNGLTVRSMVKASGREFEDKLIWESGNRTSHKAMGFWSTKRGTGMRVSSKTP